MKTKLFLLAAVAAISLTPLTRSEAQTNTPATNAPSITGGLGEILQSVGLSADPTNYAAATFIGRSLTANEGAAGLLVIENVNNNVGVVAGFDYLWGGGKLGSANIVSGGITLKQATHPLQFLGVTGWTSNLVVTPYAMLLTGTPTAGTSNNGGLCAIARAGANVDLYNLKGFELGAGIDYGNRTGAGAYNGNWIDFVFTIRKGF